MKDCRWSFDSYFLWYCDHPTTWGKMDPLRDMCGMLLETQVYLIQDRAKKTSEIHPGCQG